MSITPEELYDGYREKVERYVRSHIQNEQDRADIVHEVFLNAISALKSYDPSRSAIGTWLYAITKNAVVDYYRRLSRTPQPLIPEELTEEDDRILTAENLDMLASALERLPDRERKIIVLRFYYGLSPAETAQRVGVSYSNVRFLQHSALKKLRRFLEESECML